MSSKIEILESCERRGIIERTNPLHRAKNIHEFIRILTGEFTPLPVDNPHVEYEMRAIELLELAFKCNFAKYWAMPPKRCGSYCGVDIAPVDAYSEQSHTIVQLKEIGKYNLRTLEEFHTLDHKRFRGVLIDGRDYELAWWLIYTRHPLITKYLYVYFDRNFNELRYVDLLRVLSCDWAHRRMSPKGEVVWALKSKYWDRYVNG